MLPLSPDQLSTLVHEAKSHQAAGRLAQARESLEIILQAKPDLAVVHFNLAQILLKMEETEQALQHLDRAVALKPDEPAVWKQYATALLWIGDAARSAKFLTKAKRARLERGLLMSLQTMLRPKPEKSKTSIGSVPPSEIQRTIELLGSGQHSKAMETAQRLSRAHPEVAIIWDMLAFAQSELGLIEEAEKNFRRSIGLDPKYAEARANYGQFLLRQARLDEAISQLREALRLVPKLPLALTSLGTALHRQSRNLSAITFLKRALALDGNILPARLELAESYLNERMPEEAMTVLEPIRDVTMPNAKNKVLWARALSELQKNEDAEAAFDTALEEATNKTMASAEKATFLQMLGRFDEAEVLFRQAIDMDPLTGKFYRLFIVTKKMSADDPLIPKMEEVYDNPAITDESRMYLGYAMAKAMEDTKQYDRMFTYLRPANDKMRELYPYDIQEQRDSTRELLGLFEKADFTPLAPDVASRFAPIFVTGLPRSGTTLVEQIIASHSTVTGGGELGYAFQAVDEKLRDHINRNRKTFDLPDKQFLQLGRDIEARMREPFEAVDRMTDKGLGTYEVIGPIRKIFPNAKIIVVRRDPRDSLLSMYKNTFAEGRHRYATKLPDLAVFYQTFLEILDFWREKLPGSFVEIEYEALIADPEAESRKLIAACGLEWEDQCLSFHENKRRVSTLSLHQVRQPMYSSSMKAWERYSDDLGELFEALGPEYLPGD